MNRDDDRNTRNRGNTAPASRLIDRLRASGQFDEPPRWDGADGDSPHVFAVVDVSRRLSAAVDAAAFRSRLQALSETPELLSPATPIALIRADALDDDEDINEFLLRALRNELDGLAAELAERRETSAAKASQAAREAAGTLAEFLRLCNEMGNRSLLDFRTDLSTPAARAALGGALLVIRRMKPLSTDRHSRLVRAARELVSLFDLGDCVLMIADTQRTGLRTLNLRPSSREELIALLRGDSVPSAAPSKNDQNEGHKPDPFWHTLENCFRAIVEPAKSRSDSDAEQIARLLDLIELACRPSRERILRVRRAFLAFADKAGEFADNPPRQQAALQRRQARTDSHATADLPWPWPDGHAKEVDWSQLENLDDAPRSGDDLPEDTQLERSLSAVGDPPLPQWPIAVLSDDSGTSIDGQLADAARQTWTAAAFLKILEAVFPDLLGEAWKHEENLYRLYLFLSFAANPGSSEPPALNHPRWKKFRANERLMACCRFAFAPAGSRGEALVQPFASVRALRQHLSGLLAPGSDAPAEDWNEHVLELNRFVTGAIESTTTETREFRQRSRQARQNLKPLTRLLLEHARAMRAAADTSDTGRIAARVAEANRSLMDVAARIARNDDFLRRAQQELDAREREGFPLGLYRWLIRAENYFVYAMENAANLSPYDCNEYGHRYLSVQEIWCAGPQTLKPWREIKHSIDRCIDLLQRAAEQSLGAVTFEATLGLIRAHAIALLAIDRARDAEPAKAPVAGSWTAESVRLRHLRARDDAIAHVSEIARGHADLQLHKSLVTTMLSECDGRWTEAEAEYIRIQEAADAAGYIEIAARAGYSAMRARAQQVSRDERRGLFWAQGFLRLYAARSPFMSNRDRAMFVSYRRDTQPWVRAVCQAYEKKGTAKIWVDYDSIIDGNADYRAEMQLGLDRADWIVLVLSPGYFESPWCTYELTTALARRRLNNQNIAWVCVDDNCPADRLDRPEDHARELAKAASRYASEAHFFATQLDLVLNQTRLSPQVVVTRGTAEEEQRDAVVASIVAFAKDQ